MSCASQSVLSASSCAFPSNGFLRNVRRRRAKTRIFFSADASSPSTEDSDCNDAECAPDKEVGKVSMEWLAGEKTKVVGTFPPRRRGWTGYVEKDTAGQTNIYSVEPSVYIAENAISSGTSGSSSEGSENTLAIAAGLALISVAAASSILLQVGKNAPQIQTADYAGPPLSYYISKFKTVNVKAPIPVEVPDSSPPVESERLQPEGKNQPEALQVQVESSDRVRQVQVELSNKVSE